MPEHKDKAETMLTHLRVHGSDDGPAYGSVKAQAATAYAVLALVDRLDMLIGLLEDERIAVRTSDS